MAEPQSLGPDFAPMVQCLNDIEEAMELENTGGDINLLPPGCILRESEDVRDVWIAYYPIYRAGEAISFHFYLDDESELVYVGAEQGDHVYFLTNDEQFILEDLWAWLEINGETVNVEDKITEGES